MDAANRLPPLGWPWDALQDAGRRLERADREMLVAGTAGDVTARCAAELDRERAILDFFAVREELALQWLSGFRWALERYPAHVADLLRELPPARAVTDAIGELEDRVDAAEDAVVKLEHGQVYR